MVAMMLDGVQSLVENCPGFEPLFSASPNRADRYRPNPTLVHTGICRQCQSQVHYPLPVLDGNPDGGKGGGACGRTLRQVGRAAGS